MSVYGTATQGTGLDVWAEITAPGSTDLVEQSDVASATYQMWLIPPPPDAPTGNVVEGPSPPTVVAATSTPLSLTIADVIKEGGDVVTDSAGVRRNFVALIPVTSLPTLDPVNHPKHQWAQLAVRFVPTTGEPYIRTWNVDIEPVLYTP